MMDYRTRKPRTAESNDRMIREHDGHNVEMARMMTDLICHDCAIIVRHFADN